MKLKIDKDIKAIVGLGNPGPKYIFTPHNIGFLVLDQLAQSEQGLWIEKHNMLQAEIVLHDRKLLLIKPQTYMNNSGEILKYLQKQGINLENLLVVHDEIDFTFGKIALKDGGSARGHNGLRSLIACGGQIFLRLRCGVGRPDNVEDVGDFVTAKFQESLSQVQELIEKSVKFIKEILEL